MNPPCSSSVPKPSQISVRPASSTIPRKAPGTRILNIRLAGPYSDGKCERSLLIWCSSTSDEDDLPTEVPVCLTGKGKQKVLAGDEAVLMQWKTIRCDDVMDEMCNILTAEISNHPGTPLEFHTHFLAFASQFRQVFDRVPDVSWAQNYPLDIRPADELCMTFGRDFLAARQAHAELSRTWQNYEGSRINGHMPVPEKWQSASEIVHIAVDASANRHNRGAYAFVTSLGDFQAEPTRGPILCCELMAIAQAVHFARHICGRVVIWSDSRLALNQIARMRSQESTFLPQRFHQPLWEIQNELRARKSRGSEEIVFRWIKAHTDCSSLQRILNDGADRLARHTMRNVSDADFTDGLAAVCQDIVADCMDNLATLEPCSAQYTGEDIPQEHYDSAHDSHSGS